LTLTPADMRMKHFGTTRLRPGYDELDVDAFLDKAEAELSRLIRENNGLRAKLTEFPRGQPDLPATAPAYPLLPEAVRAKRFRGTRLRPGYVTDEVHAFLDEVATELGRQIQENQDLRAKLAESPDSGGLPDFDEPF
jgi:DivIVA domain-containing protein